jgi:CheY-like chemotaxis protein
MSKNVNTDLMNILYVDDDSDDRDFFMEGLNSVAPNSNLYLAADAVEARGLLTELNQNLNYIFLDINMPGTNGLTFLSEIKQDEDLRSIPVIIYSTASSPKYAMRSRELGALDYITKPVTFAGICKMLEKYFAPDSQAGRQQIA